MGPTTWWGHCWTMVSHWRLKSPKWYETTLNYRKMVEIYLNLKEEVGSSNHSYEISLSDEKLARWLTTSCALAMACRPYVSKHKVSNMHLWIVFIPWKLYYPASRPLDTGEPLIVNVLDALMIITLLCSLCNVNHFMIGNTWEKPFGQIWWQPQSPKFPHCNDIVLQFRCVRVLVHTYLGSLYTWGRIEGWHELSKFGPIGSLISSNRVQGLYTRGWSKPSLISCVVLSGTNLVPNYRTLVKKLGWAFPRPQLLSGVGLRSSCPSIFRG
jgi:hypothetical protein